MAHKGRYDPKVAPDERACAGQGACTKEFKRRIKTQTVLPSADTVAMLFWALLASGPINMCKVDGWQTLATKAHRSAN